MEITEYVEFNLIEPCAPLYLTLLCLFIAADLKREAFWQTAENRKEYLCNIAEGLGFDPFELENWNKVTNTHIVRNKVGGFTIQPYMLAYTHNLNFRENICWRCMAIHFLMLCVPHSHLLQILDASS